MKTSFLVSGWFLAAATLVAAATNDLATSLQRGLFEEEANHNLDAAIQAYQSVAAQFDKDRKLAATAIFRLGECYRKQGNTNEAAALYQRIVREFSDQAILVNLSRQNLAGLGSAPATAAAPAAPVLSNAARQEQQRLLEEEIKLVEKKLGMQQAQAQSGAVGQDALLDTQRELLKLKRQMAALEAGQPVIEATSASGEPAPAPSTEAAEIKRIQTLVKESPDLINAPEEGRTLLYKAADKGQFQVAEFLLANGADISKGSLGETPLHAAVRRGHKNIVELLLAHGADVNAAGGQDRLTPLHIAAQQGARAIAEQLLNRQADVNARDKQGRTPLDFAAEKGFKSVAELLLAHKADINAQDEDGNTALLRAVMKQNSEVARLLLAHKANVNIPEFTPLHSASYQGALGLVELLLTNGADPNAREQGGETPLHRAAGVGSVPVAERLIAAKAEVNAKNKVQATPLVKAVRARQLDTARVLLAHHADPNLAADEVVEGHSQPGFYPLHYAIYARDDRMLELLLENGANPNVRSAWQEETPLSYALVGGRSPPTSTNALALLLQHKANPNLANSQGLTPLLRAVSGRNLDAVALLLAYGADPNLRDREGHTPLDYAVQLRHLELAKALVARKADVNAPDRSGTTPLMLAVNSRDKELVELLLANGADPNLRNKEGKTALDFTKNTMAMGVPRFPGAPVGPPGSGFPPVLTSSETVSITDLLRQRGAQDDLPRPDAIELRRPTAKYSAVVFSKGTNDYNRFTLLELLAVHYGFVSADPARGPVKQYFNLRLGYEGSYTARGSLAFPNLEAVVIRRQTPAGQTREALQVNLSQILRVGECSRDPKLEWGDVVELPEADHPINATWQGLPPEELRGLTNCLRRQVQLTVKGQTTNIVLVPQAVIPPQEKLQLSSGGAEAAVPQFCLVPVLYQSGLLRASSDLSRVRVSRRDPTTGQSFTLVLDCSRADSPPDFWLRNGDRIEVPEKAEVSSSDGTLPSEPAAAAPGAFQENLRRLTQGAAPAPGPAVSPPAFGPQAAPVIRIPPTRTLRVPKDVPAASPPPSPAAEAPAASPPPSRKDNELTYAWRREAAPEAPVPGGSPSTKSSGTGQWEQRSNADMLKGRGGNTAVWTGQELLVFGGEGLNTGYDDGARYDLAKDKWTALPAEGTPSMRSGHAAVWTGKEMLIWGGFGGTFGNNVNRDDGARFNPAGNSWKPLARKNAPAARFDFTAVWTGKEMLVWGGYTDSHSRYQGGHADAHLNSGGRYDPHSDSWKPITTKNAPSKRCGHTAVWTGKEMLIWGGYDAVKVLDNGARYNPARDTWKPISAEGVLAPRASHVAVWTGKEMLVWGGSDREGSEYYENGARYNPETDTWKPLSTVGAPKGRVSVQANWTGTEMIFWGGVNDAGTDGPNDSGRFVGSGAAYHPATDSWRELPLRDAPSARLASAVWTGQGLLLFGGYNGTHLSQTWYLRP